MARWSAKCLLAASILVPTIASAQQIATRADLNSILLSQTIETFDAFNSLASGTAAQITSGGNSVTVLDNSTATDQFGTGAVSVFLRFTGPTLQANAANYYDATSANLVSNGGALTISFLSSVNAIGVDLFNYAGYAEPFSVSAFGPGNTLLGTVKYDGVDAPASEFFGWESAGGIDHIEVGEAAAPDSWSSLVDNVTFGRADISTTASPEPSSVVLMATGFVGIAGAVRRKRKA